MSSRSCAALDLTLRVQPLGQRHAIPLLRLLGLPRRLERDRLAHLAQLEHRRAEAQRRPRAQAPRDRAPIAVLLAVDDHHGFAVGVLLEGRDVEFVHQRIDPVLRRTDPRAALVDPRPVVARHGERPAADAVACFQQSHRLAGLLEAKGRGQARETSAYHANVDVSHADKAYLSGAWQSMASSAKALVSAAMRDFASARPTRRPADS